MKGITSKYLLFIIILGGIFVIITPIFAHPGRTDSSGCHTCRTNCPSWGLSYGEYHCHRAKALPQPKPPVKSHRDPGGSGWTEPAPEYNYPNKENNVSNNFSAQARQIDNKKGESNLGWIFGLGMGGLLLYYIFKKR